MSSSSSSMNQPEMTAAHPKQATYKLINSPRKRNLSSILFFVSYLLFFLQNVSAGVYREVLTSQFTYQPCELSSSSGTLYPGLTSLKVDGSSTISGVSMGGWFFPRGYLDQFYTIFSFHEQTTPISTVYSFSYSPNTYTIRETLGTLITVDTILTQFTTLQWFYILSFIHYNTTSTELTGGTAIWESGKFFYSSTLVNPTEHQHVFTKANLLFNIGNSNVNLPSSITPSCCVSRYASVFSQKVGDNEISTPREDVQGTAVFLLLDYDAFYTPQNPGRLMNYGKSEDSLVIPSSVTNPLTFPPSRSLTTEFINANHNYGFTFAFSVLMSSTTFTKIRLLTIVENVAYVDALAGSQLSLSNQRFLTGIDFSQWVYIIVMFKQGLVGQMVLTALDYHSQNKFITIPFYQTVRLRFGHSTNTDAFEIGNIRVHQGMYFSSGTGCFFASHTRPSLECLVCNSDYIINRQSGVYNCVKLSLNTPDPFYQYQLNWSPARISCPKGMLHDLPSTTTCRCRNQHFKTAANTCERCMKYCNGCTGSATACDSQHPNRLANGECAPGKFDDGYNCKEILQLIPNTNIPTFLFASPSYSAAPSSTLLPQSQTFDDTFLNLSTKSTLFITFSFQPYSLMTYVDAAIATISLGASSPSTEVITILITTTPIGKQIKILITGTFMTESYIHPNNASWYAIWSNRIKTIICIHSNGMLITHVFNTSFTSIPMLNPLICIGSCTSAYTTPPEIARGILTHRPFRCIADVPDPSNDTNQILSLILIEATIIAQFSLELKNYESPQLGKYPSVSTTPGYILDFKGSTTIVNQQQKGFGFFYGNTYAKVNLGMVSFPISFSTTITIDKMNTQINLLTYTYLQLVEITYYLVPSDLLQNVLIRICFGHECQDTEFAKLDLAKSNYLAISTMDLSPFSYEFLRISFKVVCNYASELLTFILDRPRPITSAATTITLCDKTQESDTYQIFLNRILFITGNGYFYEDFDGSNNCFFSINSNPSQTCIRSKSGYVIDGKTAISEYDCINDPTSLTIRFVNPITGECIDSGQPKLMCKEVDHNTRACIQCTLGFFQYQMDTFCTPCSPQCLQCQGTSTNCISCKLTTVQLPPSCECVELNYFFNESSQCEQCSKECTSCEFGASNCTKCAPGRAGLPTCACDPQLTYLNPSTGDCIPYTCQIQCSSCLGSPSNCSTCKANRGSPPECECITNAFEIPDGTCQSCAHGTYYDKDQAACLPCALPCQACKSSPTNCLECQPGLLKTLNENTNDNTGKCTCSNNFEYIIRTNGQGDCVKGMDTTFALRNRGSVSYLLEFTFPDDLFTESGIDQHAASDLLEVSLSDIPREFYSIQNPVVSKNLFTVDLIISQGFILTSGYVVFLKTIIFVNVDQTLALSKDYLTKPFLIKLSGQLLLPETETPLSSVGDAMQQFEKTNPGLLKVIQGMQLLLYMFNSLQPTMLILLLNIQLPPNLFTFLEMFGVCIFPSIDSMPQEETIEVPTIVLDVDWLSDEFEEQKRSDESTFNRLGFSTSALISIPVICGKYICILACLFLSEIWSQSKFKPAWADKFSGFVIEQLLTENEVNLLLAAISVFIEFENATGYSWMSRYGFYCGIAIIFAHVYAVQKIVSQVLRKNTKSHPILIEKENNPYLNTLTERIKKKRQLQMKAYFFLQMIKKYVILFVIYYLRNSQHVVCLTVAGVFLVSAISTIRMKPYGSIRTRYVKIITDFNFVLTWVILAVIVSHEFWLLESQQSLDQNIVDRYLGLGYFVVIILIISNVIYMIEQIIQLFESAWESIQKKINANKNSNNNNTQDQLQQNSIKLANQQSFPFAYRFQRTQFTE